MTAYDARTVEAAAKVERLRAFGRSVAVTPDENDLIQAVCDIAIRALPVSPGPTTGEASEPSPLSPAAWSALVAAAEAYADFVAAREAMNAVRPDAISATPAERALYDERYKADHAAERAHFRTAIALAQVAEQIVAAQVETTPVPTEHLFAENAKKSPSDALGETVEKLREALAKVDLPLVQLQDSKGFSRVYSAPEEPHFRTGDLLAETFGDGDDLIVEAINALPTLLTALEQRGDGRAISDPTRRMERILDAKFTPRSTPLPTKED